MSAPRGAGEGSRGVSALPRGAGASAYPSFDLTDRVALVTGAGRGIGRDLALALAYAGARVVAGSRTSDEVDALAADIVDGGEQASAVQVDVRDLASIDAAVTSTVERYGRIDVLVNNAGGGTNHDALDVTEDDWDEVLDVNLKGLFFMCQAAGRHMVRAGRGRSGTGCGPGAAGSSTSARRRAAAGSGATRRTAPARAVSSSSPACSRWSG